MQRIFLPVFPKTLQNKFSSNLVARCLAYVVNFFVRSLHYLYFCYITNIKAVDLHICFYRKKLKPEFSFLCTAGLFDNNFFSLSQTISSVHCTSMLSPLVVSTVAGQGAEIRLMLTSFNVSTEQSILFNISMFDAFDFSHANPDSSH